MWVRINLEKNWRQNIRGPKKKKKTTKKTTF